MNKPTITTSEVSDLKQKAYDLKKAEKLSQHEALNQVAREHPGKFEDWRELTNNIVKGPSEERFNDKENTNPNDLWEVFEAIVDSAAEEYFEINTATPADVGRYAENGMNMTLSTKEEEFLHTKLKEYGAKPPEGSHDYYTRFKNVISTPIVTRFRSMATFIKENKTIGNHFFDKDTMRAFNSKVEGDLYTNEKTGDQYFITSEKRDDDPRKYTIRQALATGRVGNLTDDDFQKYECLDDAVTAVTELTGETPDTTFPRYTGPLESIVAIVKEDALDQEDPKTYLEDITRHGCQSGMVSGLIYYNETAAFYETHKAEINEWLAQDLPDSNFIKRYGDKWDSEDPLVLGNNNKNLIVWDAYESAAHKLLDLLED